MNDAMICRTGSSIQARMGVLTRVCKCLGMTVCLLSLLSARGLLLAQIAPTITWPTPAPISYGTLLSATQLNATANVPGTFTYSPASGTKLIAGNQTLSVTFTPTDTADYTTATAQVVLTVNKIAPGITWHSPAAITYGTALSATQLNANTGGVSGTYVYSPAAGAVLPAGQQTLSVTFTPTYTTNYTASTSTTQITVNPVPLSITANATYPYGSPSFSFVPTYSGFVNGDTASVLGGLPSCTTTATSASRIGTYPISCTVGTLSAANYSPTFVAGTLTITKVTPTLTWAVPSTIPYGTPLTAAQLNASAGGVAGTLSYSPAACSYLPIGNSTLSATFTPTDTTDYSSATAQVSIGVVQDQPALTVATSNNSSTFGSPVTLTATIVTPSLSGCTQQPPDRPSGAATFYDGTNPIGTGTISGSTAAFTISSLSVGQHSISASITGDSSYLSAVSPKIALSVAKVTPVISLTTSATSSTYGSSITLTATFTASNHPTGSIIFLSNNKPIGVASISGTSATLTTAALPGGANSIVASFSGDGINGAATSNTVSETISKATPTLTLASSGTVSYGSPVTLTATFTSGSGPTGSVTFVANSTVLGTAAVVGTTATLTTSALAGGPDQIEAQYYGDSNYNSANSAILTQTTTKATPTLSLSTSSASTVYGGTVTFTATLSNIAGGPPSGSITFRDNGTSIGVVPVVANTASLTTFSLVKGAHTITATYAGDANYQAAGPASANQTVTKATPVLTVSSSNTSPGFGVSVTFTATFTSGAGPTGSISFTSNGTSLGSAIISGNTAVLTTSALLGGTDVVKAIYSGDANYNADSPVSVTVTVSKATPTLSLSSSSSTSAYGGAVTFTAQLGSTSGVPPSGSISFTSNGVSLGSATISQNAAVLTTTALLSGTDVVKAIYSGDANYNAVSPVSVTQTVSKITPTLSIVNSGTSGNSFTFTATFTSGGNPTGVVSFIANGASIGSGTISGTTATFTATSMAAGTDAVSAQYTGDANYNSANSPVINITVGKATSTLVVSSSSSTSTYGGPVTLTATFSGGSGPSGLITFVSNNNPIGTGTISGTTASLTTTALLGGTDVVFAEYSGDANYNAVNSATITQTVSKATPSLTISQSGSSTVGGAITLNATFTSGNGPTGSIIFLSNSTPVGSASINGAAATLSTTSLAGGTNKLAAQYNGDANFNAVTSSSISVNESKATPTLSLVTSASTLAYGGSVTFTATFSNVSSTGPSGSVSFTSNGVSLGSASINNSVATLTTTALQGGADTVAANYVGDANYNSVGPVVVAETVTKATPVLSIASSTSTSSYGSPVTFTVNVPSGTGPTGMVTFTANGNSLGSATIGNGMAVLTTSLLPGGSVTVVANYAGDANYTAASPVSIAQTVGKITPVLSLSSSNATSTYGTGITLTATFASGSGPTGSVSFIVNGSSIGAAAINGTTATLATSSLPTGSNAISAAYAGDGNYNAASTSVITQAVSQGTPTLAISSSSMAPLYGAPVTLTVTITSGSGPTGSIQFIDNGVALGTAAISGNIATLTTTSLGLGQDVITAQYAGDTNYAGASAPSLTLAETLPLGITANSLPNGQIGQPYEAQLTSQGGVGTITWSIVSGSLPDGLTLNQPTAVNNYAASITGTPTTVTGDNPTPITFQVVDQSSPQQSAQALISITVQLHTLVAGTIYSYNIHYDAVGNVTWFKDSTYPGTGPGIQGTWNFGDTANSGTYPQAGGGYDTLNRLMAASVTWPNGTQQYFCWSYDSFGNRLQQTVTSSASTGGGASTCTPSGTLWSNVVSSYNSNNQLSGTNASGIASIPSYDNAGNMLNDGSNQYLYDAEGRICATQMQIPGIGASMMQYIYDAEGRRVAKGTINSWSCDTSSNGFVATAVYILGPGGEQLSEVTNSAGTWQWAHTNVYAAGMQIATYDADPSGQTSGKLYFHLSDWLGTRRQQTDYAGNPVLNFTGLPFGDGLSTNPVSTASAVDATEHHFTGKERDPETGGMANGNDYFGARYYASTMGRFLSPDPSTLEYADPANPQSLNLYSYVLNNPLVNIDPDGLKCFQVDGDGNLTGSSNAGDCATDSNGNPTNNDIYIDDEQATKPFMDSNGDLLGYTNGSGDQVGADGNPFYNAGTLYANGYGTPLNDIQTTTADVDTQISPFAMQLIQNVNQDNQHKIGCIAQAYGFAGTGGAMFYGGGGGGGAMAKPFGGNTSAFSKAFGKNLGTIKEWSNGALKTMPAPMGGPGSGEPFRWAATKYFGRWLGRVLPWAGAATTAYSAYKLGNCY